ncbi:Uncharacterised protein family UPF0102 [Aedoeadaptatus ivorii]|uniref:UPF0102 protein NCTC13079_00893 n=1 Tax=Aedoeadaptatus ivorii TaxID=54006 RepID=A0A448V1V0_9FIRM|nr:YraN family protein [Peptoniphilus ivorii]MDQ0507902.1 putative endonuclease [Peptoniphilus ivorii]VEJ35728.1 Uncharacterised protein family UPF0102 [Peptoniphilus ivorii]
MNAGDRGEAIATKFLRDKGHRILENNFRFARGEIDIISTYKDFLVFTEVKSRQSLRYGRPLEAVDARKRRQIYTTAEYYISRYGMWDRNIRFDIIEVYLMQPPKLYHLEGAFDGNDLED